MGLAVCSDIEMADLVNNGSAEDLAQVDPDLPRKLLHHREENVDALDAIYVPVLSETKDVGAGTRFGWNLSQYPQPKLIRTSWRRARSQVRRAINTIAGNGTAGYSGDGGTATAGSFSSASGGIAVDARGNVYVEDVFNN